jgi:hypothetical protein
MREKVSILETLDAQQKDHPGFCSDVAAALIDSELQMLAIESGIAAAGMGEYSG